MWTEQFGSVQLRAQYVLTLEVIVPQENVFFSYTKSLVFVVNYIDNGIR